ncbi:MAG: BCCT family transporter [Leptospiraceae bacterium]|nr:BCCT family transporter [Leptospiraceae bacterium]MCP5510736.1 BCCT family transporter [Leptospiraceae bacterium]
MKEIGKTVFFGAVGIVLATSLTGFFFPKDLEYWANLAFQFSIQKFGWFYLMATFAFLVFSIYLLFSPYKNIKLGNDDEEPEYPFFPWLAMLFAAGMGIGLVFWGVAEPIYHYSHPPMGMAERLTPEAARLAFRYSFFHWGLHPWSVYTVIALAIAYSQFRKGESGLISVTLRPLLGDRVDGTPGKIIDMIAVIATAFGVATSLGLGSLQITAGLSRLFGWEQTLQSNTIVIIIATILFLISANTGLDRGIKFLSNTNMIIALLLFGFVFFVGPTSFIMEVFTTTLGSYFKEFLPMSFRMTPFTNQKWLGEWTLFYWAWWIAWAPFVGTFIARISRGRTIREFVTGVLFVPSVMSALWFSVMGGSALYSELFENSNIVRAVDLDVSTAVFVALEKLPFGSFLGGIAILLVIVFFVTSADSATFVMGMLSTKGSLNPGNSVKIIWGILQAMIAIALLMSGGLKALQTVLIIIALPFSFILVAIIFSIHRSLSEDAMSQKHPFPEKGKLSKEKID